MGYKQDLIWDFSSYSQHKKKTSGTLQPIIFLDNLNKKQPITTVAAEKV